MDESFPIFAAIATAILVEALPVLALGSLLSAIIEVFVSPTRMARITPRNVPGQIALGFAGGLVLPTCECGVVPVARRLLKKGAPAPTVVAYMLSAPILNPVVLVSTFVAFRGSWAMVGGRAVVAVIVAGAVAMLVRGARSGELLRDGAARNQDQDHGHDKESGATRTRSRLLDVWVHAGRDFLDMGVYLVLGALAAAAFKTFVSPSVVLLFEGNLVLSILGMMALAILLSVCSEADAFVAASFVTFPAAAHLAFVTIGPMVDIKLIGLYAVTFRRRLLVRLIVVPIVLVFVLCWLFGIGVAT